MQPKIILTILKNGSRRTFCHPLDRSRRISSRIASAQADKFILKVIYGKDFRNEGQYFSKEETSFALSSFIERDLIKDFVSKGGEENAKKET